MTDPQDPPKPPQPAGGMTQQLVALVEEVPEDDAGEGGEGDVPDVGEDAFPPEAGPITTSKAPPLLPKEKKQVRNRALVIAVAVFVACTALALGAVFLLGGVHGRPVAQPTPPRPPTQPVATQPVAAPEHHHQPIRLDEFVFTAGADAGAPAPEAPPPTGPTPHSGAAPAP